MKPPLSTSRWVSVGLGLVIVAGGVGAYAGSLGGPFIFDDIGSVPENPCIRSLWPPEYLWKTPAEEAVAGRPVVSLTLAINFAIHRLNVRGYHATNIAIHVLSGLVLFGLIRRTLRRPVFSERLAGVSDWLAGITGLLWTVHPLQTESVTYIIQRTELLVGLFYLLTLYCALRGWASARRGRWFVAAVVACALGMGSKEVMASAPLMVLLYDRTSISGSFGTAIRRHARLYVGLAATWLILGVLILTGARSQTVGLGLHIGPLEYLRTQAGVIVWYLRLCFWPDPLVISYDWPVAKTWAECALPGSLILGLLAATAWGVWRNHPAGVAGAWFFLVLAPSSSFIPIVTEVAAERRMYLPLAAVVVLAVVAVGWWVTARRKPAGAVAFAVAAGLAGTMLFGTIARNRDYRSDIAIWRDAVARHPKNAQALTNLGVALANADRSEEALATCREALRLAPGMFHAHHAMGHALATLGRTEEAITHFRKAIELRSDFAPAHRCLGDALVTLGRHEEGQREIEKALSLRPWFADAWVSLGRAMAVAGRPEEAVKHYHRALEMDPDNPVWISNLGDALARQGQTEEAIQHYVRTLQLRPEYAPAHNNLGNALLGMGKANEAFNHLRQALELRPDYVDAHISLGYALASVGRLDDALQEYHRALEIDPKHVQGLNNLGNGLLTLGRTDEAVATFEKALAIDAGRADTYNNLANALVTAGDLVRGVECYRKAISLSPDLLAAHYNLGETYRRMQRPDEAKASYEQGLRLAEQSGQSQLAQQIREQMALLSSGKTP
ncbi:MAG: tetratricopeptide repeat protein [Phycisphaerae bacterium]|nr:tetratricopeptide repeat protein [Phycisphaerae bacterium]